MGNEDEGHRADGLDDRAPVRDRLREAWLEQAALQIDDRPFCETEAKRAAVEFVLDTRGRIVVIASEAKQSIQRQKERMDCFVARAPRNDGGEGRMSDRRSPD